MRVEVRGVASGSECDFASAFPDAFRKFACGCFRAFVHSRFVLIQLVIGTVGQRGNVRHDDVGAYFEGFFPSVGFDGLQGGRGGDVDIGHEQTEAGDHVQSETQPFAWRKKVAACCPKRCVAMFEVGAHSHHIDIHALQEKQVVGEVFDGLKRKSYHDSGAGLVTAAL